MRRHRPAGYHGNNLPGPGDFSPPDEEELPQVFIDEAREKLTQEHIDAMECPPTEGEIIEDAWQLYEAFKKQAESDAAEQRYLDKLDSDE